MTSILFLVETILCNQIRWIYLKNKKLSLNFFSIFLMYIKFETFTNKKMTLIAYASLKLRTLKDVVR